MERVLINRRHPVAGLVVPLPTAVLAPGAGAGEWELCREAAVAGAPDPGVPGQGSVTRQVFATLEAAAANLLPDEPFVLALPVETGLVQRLALPAAEPSELEEMARIQLEKILPYPAESVGMATQEVSRTDTGVVLAVETVHFDRLTALCQPLVARERWPLRVVFHPLALAAGQGKVPEAHARRFQSLGGGEEVSPGDHLALLYREAGKYVLGIRENERLSFAQALGGTTVEEVAAELPGVLLGAELDGVPTAFSVLRLDARDAGDRALLAAALNVPVELFDTGAAALASVPAGAGDGDLSPTSWRAERLRRERQARIKRRVLLGAAAYVGVLLLALVALGVMKWQVHHLDARLRTLRPLAESSRASAAQWKALAPAIDWSRYLAETVDQAVECLPPGDVVRLTAFDQTARGIALQGEAPSAAAAVEYTEKLRTSPGLKMYHFEAEPPTILPNGRARFRVSGNL